MEVGERGAKPLAVRLLAPEITLGQICTDGDDGKLSEIFQAVRPVYRIHKVRSSCRDSHHLKCIESNETLLQMGWHMFVLNCELLRNSLYPLNQISEIVYIRWTVNP